MLHVGGHVNLLLSISLDILVTFSRIIYLDSIG